MRKIAMLAAAYGLLAATTPAFAKTLNMSFKEPHVMERACSAACASCSRNPGGKACLVCRTRTKCT